MLVNIPGKEGRRCEEIGGHHTYFRAKEEGG